jgi:hypothetical protein
LVFSVIHAGSTNEVWWMSIKFLFQDWDNINLEWNHEHKIEWKYYILMWKGFSFVVRSDTCLMDRVIILEAISSVLFRS